MSEPFNVVPGPFGGVDEQATTDALEAYLGGRPRTEQLYRLWQDSYAISAFAGLAKLSKAEVFAVKALKESFTLDEVKAALKVFSS